MSNIDITRFVNVNIVGEQHSYRRVGQTRVVIFHTDNLGKAAGGDENDFVATGYWWGEVAETDIPFVTEAGLQTVNKNYALCSYLQSFFDNGGTKARCIKIANIEQNTIKAAIQALPYENVVCVLAYRGVSQLTSVVSNSTSIPDVGINAKILLGSAILSDINSLPTYYSNACVKVVNGYNDSVRDVMSIAAYLSKINVEDFNSVHDYCYTVENCKAQDFTDTQIGDILEKNLNVDVTLAGATRNIGGNCTSGADLVNTYVRILLQQSLTERLIQLLSTKPKNSAGIAAIHAAIVAELGKYVNCGYLTIDKVWNKPDLKYEYNGKSYTIITKGTPLSKGYHVSILPLSALSDDDKAQHKAPPIYLVLAEQYGIRVITINGEVI